MANNFEAPLTILCFNRFKKLVSIFSSLHQIEMLTDFKRAVIQRACDGRVLTAYKHYWRVLDKGVIVDSDDLMKLTLMEYDIDICHKDTMVYKTSDIGKGREKVRISKLAKRSNR